jgi:3',5'-cyclic AMP phosphodiesterase CpdA
MAEFGGEEEGGSRLARIAHLSDVHFGKIAHPEIVPSIVADINEAKVDLVVLSGDLTQRAFPQQYRAAAEMLASFDAPWLVVPGNHDVFPWWRAPSRIMDPLRRYRHWITTDLSPSRRLPGTAILGINSAFGRTIKGGRIDVDQLEAMRSFFESVPRSDFKILTVHHHLKALKALAPHDVAIGAESTLNLAGELGVDLILCGHLHISHVEHIEIVSGRRRVVIASAGTATSSRGRPPHRKTNFYNMIDVSTSAFRVEERKFRFDTLTFSEERSTEFERVIS